MKLRVAIPFVAAAISLAGCSSYREQRVATGAAIGGSGGAGIGGIASGTAGGAVVGGVIGAATGAIVADATRPRYYHRRHRCWWDPDIGRRVCRY